MLNTTLPHLGCPKKKKNQTHCLGPLELTSHQSKSISGLGTHSSSHQTTQEIISGTLKCKSCKSTYPILAGIAILVPDVSFYLASHVKGISKLISDRKIPKEYLSDYLEAKSEITQEHLQVHLEEDLESERVNALYLMNHYLRAHSGFGSLNSNERAWWKPLHEKGSPLLNSLIENYWDQGPFSQIERWVSDYRKKSPPPHLIELACGSGGLLPLLRPHLNSYLGVDSSFASIALARHLALGASYPQELKIPEDLLQGPVSRKIKLCPQSPHNEHSNFVGDFIVGDLENFPIRQSAWDLSIALNAMDMLDDPQIIPKLQHQLLKEGGIAIQSCPYIWHPSVSKKLRKKIPRELQSSSKAVEFLYSKEGFKIQNTMDHLPWLFFKHVRQLEIYSVHLLTAQKSIIR